MVSRGQAFPATNTLANCVDGATSLTDFSRTGCRPPERRLPSNGAAKTARTMIVRAVCAGAPAGSEPVTPALGVRSDRLSARAARGGAAMSDRTAPLLSAVVDVSRGCHLTLAGVTCDACVSSLCIRLPYASRWCTTITCHGAGCIATHRPSPLYLVRLWCGGVVAKGFRAYLDRGVSHPCFVSSVRRLRRAVVLM